MEGTKVAVELKNKTVVIQSNMELADPAILVAREQRRLTYTREQLLKLRDSPFSIMQPANV